MTWTDDDTRASLARTASAYAGPLYPEDEMADHREKIATFAKAHAGCSAHVNQPLYIEAAVPIADRVPSRLGYYIGPKPPSTCALFADECIAGAGIEHPPIEGNYVVGTAIAKLEQVAGGRGLHLGTPFRDLFTGDICIIDDGSGKDAHVMVFVGEPTALAEDGSYEVATVEGGQLPDSSGIEAFNRTMRPKDGKIYVGHRYVVAWIDADALPIGDDMMTDDGDPVRQDTDPPSSSAPTEPPAADKA